MKLLLLSLLVATAFATNQCSPRKSNPKNEKCAKDLMKDGIGSLPADLQNELMKPLASRLAEKLTKDLLEDLNTCKPEKPQGCGSTADLGPIAKPNSEQGKKMFNEATKDVTNNANQLANDVKGKLDGIGKDLGEQVSGNLGNMLGGLEQSLGRLQLPDNLVGEGKEMLKKLTGQLPDLIGTTKKAIGNAIGGLKDKFEGSIGKNLVDGAKKQFQGLKKKVTDMPKAGLDFLTKDLKKQSEDLAEKNVGAMSGEVKGLVDGFTGALGFEGLDDVAELAKDGLGGLNATVNGLPKKIEWLKSKIGSVAEKYGTQFDLGAKALAGGVFAGFLSQMPSELKEKEILSLADVVFFRPIIENALNQTEVESEGSIEAREE